MITCKKQKGMSSLVNMVALKKYERIEASGLWRSAPDEQRRDVVIVLGDATLTIKATNDTALAHWSIAAIERKNPGQFPALFHPDGDPGEEIELAESEAEMVEAIDTLRRAVERARPKPGRVRWLGFAASTAAIAYVALIWLPDALLTHTLSVVPKVGRNDIGHMLSTRIQRVTGPACGTSANTSSLTKLAMRLDSGRLSIMRGGLSGSLHLPGNQILLSRTLVEDHEDPDVLGGYVLAAKTAAGEEDPLRSLLAFSGLTTTFRLLTTGKVHDDALDAYAEHLLGNQTPPPSSIGLIDAFDQYQVRSTPYAYAVDITGETVLPLIEADPLRGKPVEPLLSDEDWLRLQTICNS